LDEEDKGIRVAHQRFQEWKKERRKQLEKVAQEKSRRTQQLEILKAARQMQQKMWMQLKPDAGGSGSGGSKMATLLPGGGLQSAMDLDPRMHTVSTTEDLKRLQEAGALDIEQDDDSKKVFMKFARPSMANIPTRAPSETTLLVPVSDEPEPEPSATDDDDEVVVDPSASGADSKADDADADVVSLASKCNIPGWVLSASDAVISFLDNLVYMDLKSLPASRPKKIAVGLYKIYQRYSHFLCYVAFLVNAAYNANVVSAFFPLSMFLYALLEIPRPHRLYWNIVFVYTGLVLLLKFMFQISIFCTCNGPNGDTWSVYPYCPRTPGAGCDFERQKGGPSFIPSYPNIIGVRKFDDIPFIVAVLPDVIVLMAVWMHRHWLKKQGYWAFVKRYVLAADDDESMQRQVIDETRHYEKILLKQAKKRERWGEMEAQHRMRRLQKARRWVSKGKANSDLKSWLIREQEELKEDIFENPIFGNALADLDPNSAEADQSRMAVQSELLARVGEMPRSASQTPLIRRAQDEPEIILVDVSSPSEEREKPFAPPKKKKDKQKADDKSSSSRDQLAALKKNRRTSKFLITTPNARRELEEQEEEKEMRKKKEKHKQKQKKKEKEAKDRDTRRSQEHPSSLAPVPEAPAPPADEPFDLIALAASSPVPTTGAGVLADLSEETTQTAFRDAALEITDDIEDEERFASYFPRFKSSFY
jgi:hypothetical protein